MSFPDLVCGAKLLSPQILPPLTWYTALTVWSKSPLADGMILAAAARYAWGVRKARWWPIRRTVCFLAGLAVLVIALNSSVNVYGHRVFAMHLVQHLLLIVVVPVLLAFGRPLELVHETGSGRLRRRVRALTRTRAAWVATALGIGLIVYCLVVAGSHLAPFMHNMLLHHWVRQLEHALYLASGYLLLLHLLRQQPIHRRLSRLLLLLLMFLAMAMDTVIGVVLLMTSHEPFPDHLDRPRAGEPDLLTDLHWGGAVIWIGRNSLMLLVVIVLIVGWIGDSTAGDDGDPS